MTTMGLMKTTPRRKLRKRRAAVSNQELLEALGLPDEPLARNLGMTKRNLQYLLAGSTMREQTMMLLYALKKYKIDVRVLRNELGLKVY